jgi:putative ABC transport system substrate-binding protein
MRRIGWVEGKNVVYDRVYGDDQHEVLRKVAAELVARGPELIYAPPTSAAVVASRATQTIPIVFAVVGNPIGAGLVKNLARPEGNITGISSVAESLAPKRVELLREILPGAKRMGLLGDPTDPATKADRMALGPLANALGLTFVSADAESPTDFDAAVTKLINERVDAIFTMTAALVYNMRLRLIDLANRARLPVIGGLLPMADDGALFAFGSSLPERFRRSAHLVDKVLKGVPVVDIPVEQATRFELVINRRAARTLGITIPQSILLRADRVIE